MTDAYKKARDEKAHAFATPRKNESTCSCCLDGFITGYDHGYALGIAEERERNRKMKETLTLVANVCRHADCVIEALAMIEQAIEEYEAGEAKITTEVHE